MKKQKELDRLTKELVKQMTGNEVEDTQEGDYQIAYYYLSKAMDYTMLCAFKITIMDETKVLKDALTEYIKWFGKREVKTDKLIEVSKQSRDVTLAMLLQEELSK